MFLNLPSYNARLQRAGGMLQIFDDLRQKFVALTPEEWVRQHFVHFLVNQRDYPMALMANEVGIKQNGCQRRCDTVIYDHAASPIAIVEYKAQDVEISEAVFDQIVRYNMVLKVPWLIVSNGMKHYCCHILGDKYAFIRDIPHYKNLFD